MLYIEPKPLTKSEIYNIEHATIKGKTVAEYPELLKYWDYEYNGDLNPNKTGLGDNNQVIWKCNKGHRFKLSPGRKLKSMDSCAICSGYYTVPGFNDFATVKPELLKYWDYEKNTISPSEIAPSCKKIVYWKCDNGHSYESSLNKRSKEGCPYCAGKKVFKGFNDFASCYPEFLKYWNYDKNDKKPDEVFKSGTYNAWLKCENGHDFQIKINKLHNQKTFCPFCNGSKVAKGVNDLESLYPNLMNEWDYVKNTKHPSEIFYKRDEKFLWKCENGHEFQMSPYRRTMCFRGCPICCESKGEKLIRKFLESNEIEFKPQFWFEDLKDGTPLRFDFGILEDGKLIQLVEFDGEQYFRPIDYRGKNPARAKAEFKLLQKHDNMKNNYCVKNKIPLLRIRYDELKEINIILATTLAGKIKHLGEKNTAGNGQEMTIIEYNGVRDITVQFEDNTIVAHVRLQDFQRGDIANPNFNTRKFLNKEKRKGETNTAYNGHEMKIIEYRNSHDIDVEFDNGEVAKNVRYSNFKLGKIALPSQDRRRNKNKER